MATSNFYNKNASHIYAITDIEDDYEYKFIVDDIKQSLKSKGYDEENKWEDSLRSYPGKILASKGVSKKINELEVSVEIQAIVRSGYYQGANFDWEVYYTIESDTQNENFTDSEISNIFDYYGLKKDQKLINIVSNYLYVQSNKLIKELERIYEKFTDKYEVLGRASNGETFYRKLN